MGVYVRVRDSMSGWVYVRKLAEAELIITMKMKIINLDENTQKNIFDISGAYVGPSWTQNDSVGSKIRAQLRILNWLKLLTRGG